MGRIISSKKKGGKVLVEFLSGYEEFLQLKGHFENVFLFSEKVAEVQANISQRGKNEATKYFLIPKQLRKGFKFNNSTSCQKIELGNKVIFIYVVDKSKVIQSKRKQYFEQMQNPLPNMIAFNHQ